MTPLDLRRLNDGARALEVSSRKPGTIAEIQEQLDAVGAGIAALQSLDDLGQEINVQAIRDHDELWKRYDALKNQLKEG